MSRTTEEPQRVDTSRAAAEWKADPGLDNIIHGNNEPVRDQSRLHVSTNLRTTSKQWLQGSMVDRSFKAAPAPAATNSRNDRIASGEGTRGVKGWTGDGKGPLNPESSMPKTKSTLI